MSQLDVELEPLSAVKQEIAGLLDRLDLVEHSDASRFRSRLESIHDAAFGASDNTQQAVHGDASLGNLLRTTDGRLCGPTSRTSAAAPSKPTSRA